MSNDERHTQRWRDRKKQKYRVIRDRIKREREGCGGGVCGFGED